MPSDERDRQFERALQRHLRADAGVSGCPDAETLAAYHERTLSLEELTNWKQHMVTCVRCQETMARVEETSAVVLQDSDERPVAYQQTFLTMAASSPFLKSSDEESVPELSSLKKAILPEERPLKTRRSKSWRWVGPVGALAAGLLVFVAVRENRKNDSDTTKLQTAENRATPAPPLPTPAIEPRSKSAEETALENPRKELATPPTDARSDVQGRANMHRLVMPSETATAHAPANAPKSNLAPINQNAGMDSIESGYISPKEIEDGTRAKQAQGTSDAAPPPIDHRFQNAAPPAIPLQAPSASSPVTSAAAGGAAGAKKKAQNSAQQPQLAEPVKEGPEVTRDAAGTVPEPPATQTTELKSQLQLSMNSRVLRQVAQSNPHLILAPDGIHTWRVGTAGLIEGSSDAGLNWKAQASGVSTDLTAGSAPSEQVCWVVGKAGTILWTKDAGKHWNPVTSPSPEDLGGVHATDAKHASIWSLGHKNSFQTTDGGATWTPATHE